MANTFAPFGFSQYYGAGSSPTYEQVTTICAYNAAAMYFGDPVSRVAAGGIAPTAPGTQALAGIFIGCKYLSVSMKRTVWSNYWGAADVASTNTVECYIVNDPNARFLAQCGGSATNLALADVGANVQFAFGTPNTTTGLSGAYIDMTVTPTTTATFPFRVVTLVQDPPGANGTALTGGYNYAVVAFNNVETKTLTGI